MLLLPYDMAGRIDTLHTQAQVLRTEYLDEGIQVEAVCDDVLFGRLRQYEREG